MNQQRFIDIVVPRIGGRFEIRRCLEGHRAAAADVEQGSIGAAQGPGKRRARIRVGTRRLIHGPRAISRISSSSRSFSPVSFSSITVNPASDF